MSCMYCTKPIRLLRRFSGYWFCSEAHYWRAVEQGIVERARLARLDSERGRVHKPSDSMACLRCDRRIPRLRRVMAWHYCSPECYEVDHDHPERVRLWIPATIGAVAIAGGIFLARDYLPELPTLPDAEQIARIFRFDFRNREEAIRGWTGSAKDWHFPTKDSGTPRSSQRFEPSAGMVNGTIDFDLSVGSGGAGFQFRSGKNALYVARFVPVRGRGEPRMKLELIYRDRQGSGSSLHDLNLDLGEAGKSILPVGIEVNGDVLSAKVNGVIRLARKLRMAPAGAAGVYVSRGDRYRLYTGSIEVRSSERTS